MMTKRYQSPRKMDSEGERLAERLRVCRHKLGYKQEEMAVILKVSFSTYIRWERQGPPNTQAHRGYVKLMLKRLNEGPVKERKRYEKKIAQRRANARLALAADD